MATKTELGDIRDAWDRETGGGRDEDVARQRADDYVADNPDEFKELAKLDIEQLVNAVDVFRAAGLENDQWRVEAWLLHHFEPQSIGGTYQATVRVI